MNSSKETALSITQGDEKVYNLTFGSAAGPLDITGATVTLSAKKRIEDQVPVLQKVITDHTVPTEGKTAITLSTADTSLSLGVYYFDIQIVGPAIPKKTAVKGRLEITWQVTKD